jgi:apolipoprotein N-acyltransferase
MELLADLYVLGSIGMAIILIADNLRLLRRRGIADTEADGKAVGWTFFFMIAEMWWAGTSLLVLWQGYARPILPVLYLAFVGIALLSGVVTNMTKGPVRSFPLWQVRVNLGFSAIFALVAIYEFVQSTGTNAA